MSHLFPVIYFLHGHITLLLIQFAICSVDILVFIVFCLFVKRCRRTHGIDVRLYERQLLCEHAVESIV
jgi:hypothetical protein